jgi:long-chain acyl-CoA synthetase
LNVTAGKGLQQMCAAALVRGDDVQAVEYEGCWYSWGALNAVAQKVTDLVADCGASSRSSIVMIARNRPSAIATEFALVAAGRTIKMVYPFQSPAGIASTINRLEPSIVIGEAKEFSEEVRSLMAAKGIAGIVIEEMDAHALSGLEHAVGTAPDAGGEPRIEILTSGTTGTPKQFPIAYKMIADFHVTPGLGVDRRGDAPGMIYAPLGNISGIYTSFAPLIWGLRVVLWDRFSLDTWLDYVRRYRPVHSGIPCAAVQTLLDANVPAEALSSIKVMGMGAAPLDPTLQREFEEKYGIPMLVSYGATEFGGPVTAFTLDDVQAFGATKRGSVGRAMPSARLRAVDAETGKELPAEREGLLEVVSPRLGPGWIRTADVGMIDADGFVWLRGRADGAIMRGGFKVLPETIERALLLHPSVSDAGVTAVADHRVGQVPGAVIVLKPGADPPEYAELSAHLRHHLLATHIPVHWRFVVRLPTNPSNKMDRLELKRLFEGEAQ